MEENEKLNAEVIAVLPNKVKISVDDLENFQLAEEKLKVGSYLRIADNDNAVLIAIIENFNIIIEKIVAFIKLLCYNEKNLKKGVDKWKTI